MTAPSKGNSYWQGQWRIPAGANKNVITLDRLHILDTIADNGGRASFQSLRLALDVSSGSMNTHLGKLEAAGLIRQEKVPVTKNRTITEAVLTPAGLEVWQDFAARMEEFSTHAKKTRSKLSSRRFRG